MSLTMIVEALVEAGASAQMILAAVRAYEERNSALGTPRQERNRRYYEKRKAEADRLKASENRLKASYSDASENRLKSSESVLNSDAPRACDKDITSNSVDRPNLTTLEARDERDAGALDWPETDKPSRTYLDQLEAALRRAGGAGLQATAPNLCILGPILALGRSGNGPPCDLNADVLPVIAARCAKARPNSISQWGYFTEAIREARDRRLAGAPASQEISSHERPNSPAAKFDRKQRNLAVAASVQPAQRDRFIG